VPLRLIRLALAGSAWLALVSAAGCGGSDGGAPDAGVTANPRLVILDPPGDALGLPFAGSATLRVRYQTGAGEPIAGEPVQFRLVSSTTADPGGATLSAGESLTDALGIARVDLVAGALETTFRVEVGATQAALVYFTVSVSQAGFAHLTVVPHHEGWRDPTGFERIELRLYRGGDVRCSDVDPDDPPASLFPPRTLSSFAETADYQNVIAAQPYTVIAWTLAPDNPTRLSWGCVELAAAQVPPARFDLAMAVRDRALRMPASAELVSALDLTPLGEAVAAAGADAPWTVLGCSEGPGQLLLDCTLDALVPDGVLDCQVHGTGATVDAIEAARGDADEFGCRPGQAGVVDSLDRRLSDAVAAGGGFPTGGDLGDLLATRVSMATAVQLRSQLEILPGNLARHRLLEAAVQVDGNPYTVDLTASDRPVLTATAGAAVDEQRTLVIGSHGFTVAVGSVLGAAWRDRALPSAGLDGRADDLGAALAASAEDSGSATSGCAAVSAIVCPELAQGASCAVAACQQAAVALDQSMTSWWRALDGSGVDLVLSGSAPLIDSDDDLVVDGLGSGSQGPGTWDALWSVDAGDGVAAGGSFTAAAVVP